jgi:hypothetical protein
MTGKSKWRLIRLWRACGDTAARRIIEDMQDVTCQEERIGKHINE